jgi:hypothetical protein
MLLSAAQSMLVSLLAMWAERGSGAGLQGCRSQGLQECRAAGVQGCRAAGVQGCKSEGLQE